MTITIKLDTGNAAFEDDREQEIQTILQRWLDNFPATASRDLYDTNGNKVGRVTVRGK